VTDQQAGPVDPAEGFGDVPADARRVTVGFDRVERWLDGVVARHGRQQWTATPTLLRARAEDGTRLWVEVPFPPLPTAVDPTPADPVAAFLAHLATPRRIGLLLVRRGGYGVGVFQGSELVASKVGSSYVQGTTKAGGWSQQRFARRRDNQARSAFATAADEVARVVLPEAARLDALVCGGDRAAVDTVLDDPRLLALRVKRSGPWLAVPDPRRAVVLQAPKQFLAVTIRIHP
jgi:Actinobacteria/chloroflexi VLRF1 release factor